MIPELASRPLVYVVRVYNNGGWLAAFDGLVLFMQYGWAAPMNNALVQIYSKGELLRSVSAKQWHDETMGMTMADIQTRDMRRDENGV